STTRSWGPSRSIQPASRLIQIGMGLAMLAVLASVGSMARLTASRQVGTTVREASLTQSAQQQKQDAVHAEGRLPLSFIPNSGQMDPSVRFGAQGPGYAFAFTSAGARLSFHTEKHA